MSFIGDYPEDFTTVSVYFTTHDGSGAPVAPLTAFEAADVSIYRNGSATQKTSTNGMTMSSPFDSIVGLHCVVIDTSNDTGDSGFWTTGGGGVYTVILNPDTETVNGQVALKVLATFGIALSPALRPTTAGRTLDVTATGEAGVDWANIGSPTTSINLSGTSIQTVNSLASGTDSINTIATSGSTLTTGSTSAGSYVSTAQLDGTYWQIADTAGTLDMYFEFNVGSVGVPTSIEWTGGLTTAVNSLKVYGYNWGSASWEQVGTVTGTSALVSNKQLLDMTTSHVGTGGNIGLVRLRFANTGLTAANFYTDRIVCGYTSVYSFPTNFSSLSINGSGQIDAIKLAGQTITAAAGVTFPSSVASPTNITAGTVTTVTNQLTAAQIATGVWQDATAGDFTTSGSIGKSLFTSGILPGASGGLFIAGTNAATTITTALTTTFTGNLTGNVGGNVTGSVGSVTGLTASNLDATISSRASQTSVDTIDDFVDTEVAAIKAKTDLIPGTIDGKTFAQLVTLIAAAVLGKASGLDGATAVYRAVDDSKDRITATVDANGNRTSITLDAT